MSSPTKSNWNVQCCLYQQCFRAAGRRVICQTKAANGARCGVWYLHVPPFVAPLSPRWSINRVPPRVYCASIEFCSVRNNKTEELSPDSRRRPFSCSSNRCAPILSAPLLTFSLCGKKWRLFERYQPVCRIYYVSADCFALCETNKKSGKFWTLPERDQDDGSAFRFAAFSLHGLGVRTAATERKDEIEAACSAMLVSDAKFCLALGEPSAHPGVQKQISRGGRMCWLYSTRLIRQPAKSRDLIIPGKIHAFE